MPRSFFAKKRGRLWRPEANNKKILYKCTKFWSLLTRILGVCQPPYIYSYYMHFLFPGGWSALTGENLYVGKRWELSGAVGKSRMWLPAVSQSSRTRQWCCWSKLGPDTAILYRFLFDSSVRASISLGSSQINISGRESRRMSRDPRSASGLCRYLDSGPMASRCRFSIPLSDSYLVDPASSHMLVSKIKPCMSKYKPE